MIGGAEDSRARTADPAALPGPGTGPRGAAARPASPLGPSRHRSRPARFSRRAAAAAGAWPAAADPGG